MIDYLDDKRFSFTIVFPERVFYFMLPTWYKKTGYNPKIQLGEFTQFYLENLPQKHPCGSTLWVKNSFTEFFCVEIGGSKVSALDNFNATEASRMVGKTCIV